MLSQLAATVVEVKGICQGSVLRRKVTEKARVKVVVKVERREAARQAMVPFAPLVRQEHELVLFLGAQPGSDEQHGPKYDREFPL